MSNKMAPDLGKLDELAKVHALSYASPHHFTMSVNGLREVIAELQLPAGNKMALDALTAAKTQLEILLPDYGRVHDETEALAKIDAAIAALQAEPQGWRPIESAPEDKNILVATAGGHVDAAFWTDEDGEGRKWWWLLSANEYAKHPIHANLIPTHWMPLPAHPKD